VACSLGASTTVADPYVLEQVLDASVPITFGPAPTAVLAPDRGLLDGQMVTITGSDLVPGQTVEAMECQDSGWLCTKLFRVTATVDGWGHASATVAVARWIRDYMDSTGDLPLDCTASRCYLSLSARSNAYEDGYQPLAVVLLPFAPLPALVTEAQPAYENDLSDLPLPVDVPVSLAPAVGHDRVVRYRTWAWTADESDFVPVRGRLTIPAGTTTASMPVTIRLDTTNEPDEVFLVELRGTGRLRDLRAVSVVTIARSDRTFGG
jgi:hypothetical protein